MLPKTHRLSTKDLTHLKSLGHRHHSSHFTLISHPNNLGHLRVANAISKKISPKATTRNILNRRLLDALTLLEPLALDILVIPKPSALKLSYPEIKQALSASTSKLSSQTTPKKQ